MADEENEDMTDVQLHTHTQQSWDQVGCVSSDGDEPATYCAAWSLSAFIVHSNKRGGLGAGSCSC